MLLKIHLNSSLFSHHSPVLLLFPLHHSNLTQLPQLPIFHNHHLIPSRILVVDTPLSHSIMVPTGLEDLPLIRLHHRPVFLEEVLHLVHPTDPHQDQAPTLLETTRFLDTRIPISRCRPVYRADNRAIKATLPMVPNKAWVDIPSPQVQELLDTW